MHLTLIHPYLNHFSIVFVVIGILLEFRANLATDPPADRLGWTTLRIGLGLWLLSLLSGYAAQSKSYLDVSVQEILNYHEVLGVVAFVVLAASLGLRIVSRTKFHRPEGAGLRGAYYAMLCVTLLLSLACVYLGSQLVFEHGLGVAPYQELQQTSAQSPLAAPHLHDSTGSPKTNTGGH